MRTKKRKLPWILTIGVIIATFAYAGHSYASPDYSRPTSAGIGYYVTHGWADPYTWGDGSHVTIAYRKGYWAGGGSPNPAIFLDFGRQAKISGQWDIQTPPPDSTIESNTWAMTVAQWFINGYNANPAHTGALAYIAVGTNNADYAWYCHNEDPNNLSPLWYDAGVVWASSLNVLSPGSKTQVVSGNDIESWIDDFSDWKSCDLGTMTWYDGYESITSRHNYDYGNNLYSEDTGQWSVAQVWNIAFAGTAYVYPEIYCTGSGWSASWVQVRAYSNMYFNGVLSDDAQGTGTCGVLSLSWSASWDNLNNTMNNAGYSNSVLSASVRMDESHYGY